MLDLMLLLFDKRQFIAAQKLLTIHQATLP
jgi:hypothetical protein